MPKYETTIVFDSFMKDEDKQNLLTKIQNFIKNNGGEIHEVDEWGKKRLAYEIDRKQYGIYVYILFSGPSTLPGLLEREYRLEESILRHLTVKFEPKLMETKTEKAESEESEAKTEDRGESSSEDDENNEEEAEEEEERVS